MKILYLLQQFPKIDSEACIANEINELRKNGHEVRVLTDETNNTQDPFIIAGDIYTRGLQKLKYFLKRITLDLINNPKKTLKNLQIIFFNVPYYKNKNFWTKLDNYLILEKLSSIKFDIIYSPFAHLEKIDKGLSIAKINHIPFIVAFRALELYGKNCRQEIIAYKKIFSRIPNIITISKFNKKQLEQIFNNSKKITVVHSTVDQKIFIPGPKKNNSNPKIITVARFIEKKGIIYLLEAIAILKKEGLNLDCTLIGDGPLKNSYNLIMKALVINESVKILPPCDQKCLSALLQATDIMVLPCIVDAKGDRDILANVLKEAMLMEVPVITSNISGIEELIIDKETGLLFPEKDPEALALAIKELIRNPELKTRLAKEGRKKIIENFNVTTEVKKLTTIFLETITDYHE